MERKVAIVIFEHQERTQRRSLCVLPMCGGPLHVQVLSPQQWSCGAPLRICSAKPTRDRSDGRRSGVQHRSFCPRVVAASCREKHQLIEISVFSVRAVANAENNTLNWVSISSAGALDMTHCDFSVRSARDEMRHIIGSSEPDVNIGSD